MRVLIADDNLDRAEAVAARLRESGVTEIAFVEIGQILKDAVTAQTPDVVIVDMSRPDRDGLEGVRAVSADNPRPIVMFVDDADLAFMEAAIEAGVSSYNVVGSKIPDVKPIVEAAVAMFRRHQDIAGKLRRAETAIDEQAMVHRAKVLLMRTNKMDEPTAHRWLQRRAMNRGKRLVEVAAEVVGAAKGDRQA